MKKNHYEAIAAPASTDDFAAGLGALCKEAGAASFIAVRVRGHDLSEIAQVLHNGSADVPEGAAAASHASIARMIETMREAGPPVLFGAGHAAGLELAGFEHGAAAIARGDRIGLIVYFGRSAPTVADEELFGLMSVVQLAAQYGLEGLKALPLRLCQLRDRELQCLRCYMADKSTKEMAQMLEISIRAIEDHLDRARVRCGVASTLAAAMVALKEGWMTTAEIRAIGRAA